MHILQVIFLLPCLCFFITAQITAPVELYTSYNTIDAGTVHGILADLNCSSFTRALIHVAVNNPNWQDSTSLGVTYISLSPVTIGSNQPFPDPDYPASYKYTTSNGLNPPLPGVRFSGQGVVVLYIAVVCTNPPCGYTLVISEASSTGDLITQPHTVHAQKSEFQKPITELQTVVPKRLNLRNRMNVNGVVNWNAWAQTATIPICANTLTNIFGANKMICFESTIVGTRIDYLFYQQISQIPNQSEFAPKWFVRPFNTNEYIRDLTGVYKLPVNRYRTLPIQVSSLQQVAQVYSNVVGWGGESASPPNPNYYVVTYEWFECTD